VLEVETININNVTVLWLWFIQVSHINDQKLVVAPKDLAHRFNWEELKLPRINFLPNFPAFY